MVASYHLRAFRPGAGWGRLRPEGREQLLRNQQEDVEEAPLGRFVRGLRALFNLALILGVSAVIVVACLYLFVAKEFEGDLDRTYTELAENSYVYDVGGNEIGEFPVVESRETVGFEGLGDRLPGAVVAVEERRFYDHWGFDPEGLTRAAWTDFRSWHVDEGGSTITEQLMKNLYVAEDERFETSFRRRFVQAALACTYERQHSKGEILTAYLTPCTSGTAPTARRRRPRPTLARARRTSTSPRPPRSPVFFTPRLPT